MQVTEGYVYQNDGRTTWNDPDRGTLQFELPDAAKGKVEVNVRAPAGCPSAALRPLGKPNQFKLDFPSSPVNPASNSHGPCPSRVRAFLKITFYQRRRSSGCRAHRCRVQRRRSFAPRPGTDQQSEYLFGEGPDVRIQVDGTGLFNTPDDQGGSGSGQNLSENLPKLYGLLTANSSFVQSVGAVKWILATVLGMLALGFILLYRKGNPDSNARGRG